MMIRKRDLLAGAALVLLSGHARGDIVTHSVSPVLPQNIATKQPEWVVCSRQQSIPNGEVNDTTSNTLNSRMTCWTPAGSNVTDVLVGFPGFGFNYNGSSIETTLPTPPFSVTATIEYPLGTVVAVCYANGQPTLTVTPGRTISWFDPCPTPLPAGATFFVRCWASWTPGAFWLSEDCACLLTTDYTIRGTNLADATQNTSTFTTTSNGAGFGPIVLGRLGTPTPVLGIIGASQDAAFGDWPPVANGGFGWERAMRGVLPTINLARPGLSSAGYLSRYEGAQMLLRDRITHLLIGSIPSNDIFGGLSAATCETNYQTIMAPFLDRGVKCYGMTILPRTTSTDTWTTSGNQTLVSAPEEAVRQIFNAWLRANWPSLGMSGLFDVAHAIDPTDSGKWSFDAGATPCTGPSGLGFATMSDTAIASIAGALYNSNSSFGTGYVPTNPIPAVIYPYPGDTGAGGGAATFTPNGFGQGTGTSYAVTAGGAYQFPPMVAPAGNWTADGIHENSRGYNEVIYRTGLGPNAFLW